MDHTYILALNMRISFAITLAGQVDTELFQKASPPRALPGDSETTAKVPALVVTSGRLIIAAVHNSYFYY